MYLKICTNKKTNRTYLSIASGYREPKTGKSKTVIIKSLGYLDVLEKDYSDPISHFKEIVKKMNDENNQENSPISIKINKNEKLMEQTNNRKNFGYSALSKIYHELEIDKFLISKFKNRNFSEFKINNIMKLYIWPHWATI